MFSAGKTIPGLEVLQSRHGAGVLVLRGEHDLTSKEQLRETLSSLFETNQLVVADFSDVLYIDSTTIAELVGRPSRASIWQAVPPPAWDGADR